MQCEEAQPQNKLRQHQGGEPEVLEVLQSWGEAWGPCPALGSSRGLLQHSSARRSSLQLAHQVSIKSTARHVI